MIEDYCYRSSYFGDSSITFSTGFSTGFSITFSTGLSTGFSTGFSIDFSLVCGRAEVSDWLLFCFGCSEGWLLGFAISWAHG